jgi:hypothetical protein
VRPKLRCGTGVLGRALRRPGAFPEPVRLRDLTREEAEALLDWMEQTGRWGGCQVGPDGRFTVWFWPHRPGTAGG